MIKFTLDKAMFDRGRMKVPELVKLSGVNKNTLYSIYNNTSTRIDLETINRICKGLNCTPGDLMEYIKEGDV
jgi:putative transcriptional regulator